ncbi:MAG TPA: GYF domain-containing protein [Polyangiaceae bacterium]|nr:GYF domain-containing protein [Polyangiaceae bacterium]
MKFSCPSCQAKYQIAEDKIAGRAMKMKCRKCGAIIPIIEEDLAQAELQARTSLEPAAALSIPPAAPRPSATSAAPAPRAPVPRAPAPRTAVPGAAVSAPPRPAAAPAAPQPAAAPAAPQPVAAPVRVDPTARPSMSRMMSRAPVALPEWHAGIDGQAIGPMTREELRVHLKSGHADAETLVWREGMSGWAELRAVPEIADLLHSQVAPPPAQVDLLGNDPSHLHRAEPLPAPAPAPVAVPAAPKPSAPAPVAVPAASKPSAPAPHAPAHPSPAPHVAPAPHAPAHPSPAPAPVAPVVVPTPAAPAPVAAPISAPPAATAAPLSAAPLAAVPLAAAPVAAAVAAPLVEAPAPFGIESAPTRHPAEAHARESMWQYARPKGPSHVALGLMGVALLGVGLALGFVFFGGQETKIIKQTIEVPVAVQPDDAPPPPVEVAPVVGDVAPAATAPGASGSGKSGSSSGAVASAGTQPAPSSTGLSGLSGLSGLGGPSSGPSGDSAGTTSGQQLDSSQVQATVSRYQSAVKRGCWEPALGSRDPSASSTARVTVSITVSPTGSVQSTSSTGDPPGYHGLASCIERRVAGWSFPRSSGTTTVKVPFVFAAQ